MSFDERFKKQLLRRLSYTEKWVNEDFLDWNPIDWTALRRGLDACQSWSAITNWLAYLVEEELKGSKKRKKIRPLPPDGIFAREFIPLVEYAKEVIKRDSPIAELAISRASLTEEEDDGKVVRKLRDDLTIHHAFAWVQEALLSWGHVDSELFDIQFEGDWPEGELTGLPSPADPEAIADQLITNSPGYALVVHNATDKAPSVVEFEQLRSSWAKISMTDWSWYDFVIMPIAPKAADWIIYYFHHNYLELGRRVGDWPHKVSFDI